MSEGTLVIIALTPFSSNYQTSFQYEYLFIMIILISIPSPDSVFHMSYKPLEKSWCPYKLNLNNESLWWSMRNGALLPNKSDNNRGNFSPCKKNSEDTQTIQKNGKSRAESWNCNR